MVSNTLTTTTLPRGPYPTPVWGPDFKASQNSKSILVSNNQTLHLLFFIAQLALNNWGMKTLS
jgi:hypothetical protein